MPKPPQGQPAVKELILRYVKLDNNTRPIDIKAKLLKDHGVLSTRNYIARTRTTYLEGLGITALLTPGRKLMAKSLLNRAKDLISDLKKLINILEKEQAKPEPIKRVRPILSNGTKICTFCRIKEQQDKYNQQRREKYHEAKRTHH